MVKIGLVNWIITLKSERKVTGGQTEYRIHLQPEYRSYIINKRIENNIRPIAILLPERAIEFERICIKSKSFSGCIVVDDYDFVDNKRDIFQKTRYLSFEIATMALNWQCNEKLGVFEETKRDYIYILATNIMKFIERNESDDVEIKDMYNLVEEQRAAEQRIHERELEAIRRAEEIWQAHNEEEIRRQGFYKEAEKISLELLNSLISENEKKEIEKEGSLIVENVLGKFVIPTTRHGLIEKYVDGKYEASYCIVYKDYSIPYGDEIAMKYILLKTDLQKFLQTANQMVTTPYLARRIQ